MQEKHSRRRFLAVTAVGAVVSAGCLGRIAGGDPRAMGEAAGDGGETVSVSGPRVQRTFVYDNSVWRSVEGRADSQYLVVDVATEGFDRARTSFFDVAVDGQRLDADAHAVTGDAGVADGPVAFPVPVAPAEAASVVWKRTLRPNVRWQVPDAAVADFVHAPAFRVMDVTFTRADGLGVAVENAGDRDGTFRLRISTTNVKDLSHVAKWDVPAGESVTHTVPTADLSFANFDDGVTFELSWGTGSTERSFEG